MVVESSAGEYSADGSVLVVTEKATNLVDTFAVDEDGVASEITTHPSAGVTPFGFAFTRRGTFAIKGGAVKADFRPIEEGCACFACRHFSRAYIRHLLNVNEILGLRAGTTGCIACRSSDRPKPGCTGRA